MAAEAPGIVMSRIRSIDPENASKISGYVLMNLDEEELIRLAFGPEALLLSYINQAKAFLRSASSKSSNPNPVRPFLENSPRILIPSNGFHFSNPSPPPATTVSPRPNSYAAVLNGGPNNGGSNGSGSSSFYGGELFIGGGGGGSLHHQDQLSFDDQMTSPSGYGEDANNIASPHTNPNPFHRRSFSVNDAGFLEEGGGGGGFGFKPCMYFARGFCKNGSSCKFVHSDETMELGSPSSGFDELLRVKALQQQRFALMASSGHHPFSYNQRNIDFSAMGMGSGSNSSARQIYLTFPADSTFKEEDVSSYFSTFGPVQDVRIPYQQKRMFGFVTFVYPETVKLILAKGNPHFVCDSRVLVKPYKEKGKIPDKKHFQQQLSPSRMDSRELFDLPIGPRMLLNTQELMLRRKLEQEAEIQQAIERRMMNLQLMDIKNLQNNNNRFLSISSPRQAALLMSQSLNASSDAVNEEIFQDFDPDQEASKSRGVAVDNEKLMLEGSETSTNNHQHVNDNDSYTPESLGLVLPDGFFSSPTKLAAENHSIFSQSLAETDNSTVPVTNTSSTSNNSPLSLASLSYSENTSN